MKSLVFKYIPSLTLKRYDIDIERHLDPFISYFFKPWMQATRSLVIFLESTVSTQASSNKWHQLKRAEACETERTEKTDLPLKFLVVIEFATVFKTTCPGENAGNGVGARWFTLRSANIHSHRCFRLSILLFDVHGNGVWRCREQLRLQWFYRRGKQGLMTSDRDYRNLVENRNCVFTGPLVSAQYLGQRCPTAHHRRSFYRPIRNHRHSSTLGRPYLQGAHFKC